MIADADDPKRKYLKLPSEPFLENETPARTYDPIEINSSEIKTMIRFMLIANRCAPSKTARITV
jgi:hypothetical protein